MTGWRFTCPNGHTTYRYLQRTNNIRCDVCASKYDRLLDKKTGDLVRPGERR